MDERRKYLPFEGRGCAGWLATVAALVLSACGQAVPPENDGSDEVGPGMPEPFEDTEVRSVSFDVGSELKLPAGSSQALRVRVEPPGERTVRLALVGDGREAFLSDSILVTAADGVALPVTLTVRAANSDFAVRATVGRVRGELHVLTLPADTGTLVVTPYYQQTRAVARWFASVHLDTRCEDLPGTPPPDGPYSASASDGTSIRILDVPAGRALAVVARAEQFAGGCRNMDPIPAGTESDVRVEVADRPLHVDGITLSLSFGLVLNADVVPAFDELVFRAVSPMAGGEMDDLEAVLKGMSAAADTPLAFDTAREANSWRALLLSELGANLAGTGLRGLARSWMQSGLVRLSAADAFTGSLRANDEGEQATLVLSAVAGLTPAKAGFQEQNAATLGAESNDFLRVGAPLVWLPSPFFSNIAELEAPLQYPAASSAAEALGLAFGCSHVGEVLVAANMGAPAGQAFPGCDNACVVGLCQSAMLTLWSRVQASNVAAVAWDISGAAKATVDAEARPAQVDGSWAGSLTIEGFGTGPSPMGGPFRGVRAAD